MQESEGVQPSVELEAVRALTQLSDEDKRRVLEYIESLIILEATVNNEQGSNHEV